MYIDKSKNQGTVARFGVVSVEVYRHSYRIRFRYKGERKQFTVGKISQESFKIACDKALQIDRDILYEQFDETLAKYAPKYAQSLKVIEPKPENLKTVWEQYKNASKHRISKTNQKDSWKTTDRALAKLSYKGLNLENPQLFLSELLEHYSVSSIERRLTDINAACNWAVSIGLIKNNPYSRLKRQLPKKQQSQRSRECFEIEEVKAILEAFSSNTFQSFKSQYPHSFYSYYVELLALTGFRPEEAIALTWNDIKERNERTVIVVNKAYSKGELKPTKTHETRIFPCNDQLVNLLKRIPKRQNPNSLVFPSVEGGYIDQHNFLNRYWKPVVSGLFKSGKISQYLPCYNLRHSFITRLIRAGYDPSTVAALSGNSTQVILKHYLAVRRDVNLPEF